MKYMKNYLVYSMNKEKILNLIGLAARARMTILGEEVVIKTISNNPNSIVFLAKDSGNNIKKKIRNKTKTYNCYLVEDFTSSELSKTIGKENRKIVLVTDKGFIKKFLEYINS